MLVLARVDGLLTFLAMHRPRVLFVEDDGPTRELYRTSFDDEFAVVTADSGEQALDVADETHFDALVVDLALGEGRMRGDQFVTEFRHRIEQDVPVIVVSGVPLSYEISRSLRAAAHLPKPIDVEDLERTVSLFTRQRRS